MHVHNKWCMLLFDILLLLPQKCATSDIIHMHRIKHLNELKLGDFYGSIIGTCTSAQYTLHLSSKKLYCSCEALTCVSQNLLPRQCIPHWRSPVAQCNIARGVAGSRPTGGIVLCHLARYFILCLVLVLSWKCPDMTENCGLRRKTSV